MVPAVMLASPIGVSVASARPLRVDDGRIVFAAEDGNGPLELDVPLSLWESLQAEAPLPGDAEDRRDYALGKLEELASAVPVAQASGQVRQIILN